MPIVPQDKWKENSEKLEKAKKDGDQVFIPQPEPQNPKKPKTPPSDFPISVGPAPPPRPREGVTGHVDSIDRQGRKATIDTGRGKREFPADDIPAVEILKK